MIVIWRSRAIAERERAVDFIRLDNQRAAREMLSKLVSIGDSLAKYPYRGRPGIVAGTRELTVRPYILVYLVDAQLDEVHILRLWHAAQDR